MPLHYVGSRLCKQAKIRFLGLILLQLVMRIMLDWLVWTVADALNMKGG
jgi:hypothetical protein